MLRPLFLLLLACPLAALSGEPVHGGPVIDMHLHAFHMDEVPPGVPACPGDSPGVLIPTIDPGEAFDPSKLFACNGTPIFAAASDADLRDRSIAALQAHGVRRAVTEGPVELVADWRKAAPVVILPGGAGLAVGQQPRPFFLGRKRDHGRVPSTNARNRRSASVLAHESIEA